MLMPVGSPNTEAAQPHPGHQTQGPPDQDEGQTVKDKQDTQSSNRFSQGCR